MYIAVIDEDDLVLEIPVTLVQGAPTVGVPQGWRGGIALTEAEAMAQLTFSRMQEAVRLWVAHVDDGGKL